MNKNNPDLCHLLGTMIQQERKNCHYTQKQLADILGTSLQNIELGKQLPHSLCLFSLMELFSEDFTSQIHSVFHVHFLNAPKR